jgi:hypothetical protein
MANALVDVQATYTSLDKQYNFLRVACQTEAQRDALADEYSAAMLNYQKCVNQILQDDDAQVAKLSVQLKAANVQVNTATAQAGNMSKVISDITTAVTVGSQLVGMI